MAFGGGMAHQWQASWNLLSNILDSKKKEKEKERKSHQFQKLLNLFNKNNWSLRSILKEIGASHRQSFD